MRLSKIEVENFKGIDHLSYIPTMLNIIVGRNNTGKTSLLEAITFAFSNEYVSVTNGKPTALINFNSDSGRVRVSSFNGAEQERIVEFRKANLAEILDLVAIRSKELIKRYSARMKSEIDSVPNEREIYKEISKKEEILKSFDVGSITPDRIEKILGKAKITEIANEAITITRGNRKITETGERYNDATEEVSAKLLPESFREDFRQSFFILNYTLDDIYSSIDRKSLELVKTVPILLRSPLTAFPDSLDYSDEKENIAHQIEKIIKEENIVPGLVRFNFEHLVFEGQGKDVPMDSMGDGFKVLISIISTILSQNENSVILIEEPEVHMHPGYLKQVVNYLLRLSRTKDLQLFMSTHSMDFIDEFLNTDNMDEEDSTFLKNEMKIIRLTKTKNSVLTEEFNFSEASGSLSDLMLDLRGI